MHNSPCVGVAIVTYLFYGFIMFISIARSTYVKSKQFLIDLKVSKLYKRLIEAVEKGDYKTALNLADEITQLKGSSSWIISEYCNAINNDNCKLALFLSSIDDVDYFNCRFAGVDRFINCLKNTPFPYIPKGLNYLLSDLYRKDRYLAIELAQYIVNNVSDPILVNLAKYYLNKLTKPNPKRKTYNLPNDWVGAELYGYKVKSVIGEGGTSYILLGEKGGKDYALKIYKFDTTTRSQTITMKLSSNVTEILRESAKLQEISEKSKNIVKLYGVFIDVNALRDAMKGNMKAYFTSPPTIIMEYMAGGSLKNLLDTDIVYSVYWKDVVILVSLKVAYAIKAIHDEGYVHLDIKPQNIFFTGNMGKTALDALEKLKSGSVEVKLGDLGSARVKGRKVSQYTPEYCGIDQVEAIILGKGADPKMDLFAFGSTIYKMIELRTFNPPQLVELTDKAVEAYVNGGPFLDYINQAKSFYVTYYQYLRMSDKTFENIVKWMTHPDPNQRPDINTVISWLEQLGKSMT